MALYAIGDVHLSLGCDKPMDIFHGWDNYVARLEENWRGKITQKDTVLLCGDTSWGMSLEGALADFAFLDHLPGRKLLIKGNHDYWWSTRSKMERFFSEKGLDSLEILHNNCVPFGRYGICGTRGWIFEKGEPQDVKVLARENGRLEVSLADCAGKGLEPIVFLHYPPVYLQERSEPILETLGKYGVRRCYYGHLHGASTRWAVNGPWNGLELALISSDYLRFDPVLVAEEEPFSADAIRD